MPRKYVKVVGSTRRHNYDEKHLHAAVSAVRRNSCTIMKASTEYGVPYTTLHRALNAIEKNEPVRKVGGQTVLSAEEETMIVDGFITCSEWGYPLTKLDIRNVVSQYLNRLGRSTRFVNNQPGLDWVKLFLHRHPRLSEHVAERVRAKLKNRSPSSRVKQKTDECIDSLISHLREKYKTDVPTTRTRKRRLALSPSKSIAQDMFPDSERSSDEDNPEKLRTCSIKKPRRCSIKTTPL